MASSLSTPMNFMANVLDNFRQDPQASQYPMLAAGVAVDTLKNTPIDLFSNVPHFNYGVDDNEPANTPVGGSGV